MKKMMFAAVAFSAAISTPTFAATVVVSGATTLASPVFNRPLVDLSGLSAVGTAVRYQTTAFTVSTSGAYTLSQLGLVPLNWDTFLILYKTAFNPASPLTNALAAGDDPVVTPPFTPSTLTANLLTGASYFAVATGFANSDVGTYSLTISGPGSIIVGGGAVPEPTTWAMIMAGFAIVGGALRRRRRASVAFA